MKSISAILLATVLAGPGLAHAADAAKAKVFKAPINANGQPDLAGSWTNASLTRLERDPMFGEKAAYTTA
jgi:hypothetical protein